MPGPFPTKSVVLIPSDGADGLTPQAEAVRVSLPQGAVAKSWGTDASGAAVQGEPIDSIARDLAAAATSALGRGRYALRPETSIVQVATASGWVSNSAIQISVAEYPKIAPNGRASGLRLVTNAADTFAEARCVTDVTSFTLGTPRLVCLWVYWPDGQSGNIGIRFTSDAFASKTRTFTFAYPGQVHAGWNLLVVDPDDDGTTSPNNSTWASAGGMTTSETVNGVAIQLNNTGGSTSAITAYIASVHSMSAGISRGAILIGFDQISEASIASTALPIMKAEGFAGYHAGDGDLMTGTAADRLDFLYDAGWDVIQQGIGHIDYAANIGALESDFDAARAILQSRGWTRALDFFAYPYSANSEATDAILADRGVRMARSGKAWTIRSSKWGHPKLIGHGAVNIGGKTLTTVKKLVDKAANYGETISLYAHGITAGGDGTTPPADQLYWYVNDFQSLITYISGYVSAGNLECMSPSEWAFARGI